MTKVVGLRATLLKRDSNRGVCFVNIAKFLRTVFYRTPPVAAFGYSNQAEVFRELSASKFQGQYAVQFKFCKYEGPVLQLKQKITRGFPCVNEQSSTCK